MKMRNINRSAKDVRTSVPVRIATVFLCAGAALVASGSRALAAAQSGPVERCSSYTECYDLGLLAYMYGYPLVIVDATRKIGTNVQAASSFGAPINQFAHFPLPTGADQQIVLPSVNTPYSSAFLDVSKEPVILSLPDLSDRYFLIQVLDGWTNSAGEDDACLRGAPGFCALGSRYGTEAGDYAFVGPQWTGTLPPGIRQVIRMPTNSVWLAGRVLTSGTAADMAQVDALRQQFALTPLGKYGKRYSPPTHSPVDPKVTPVMATPPYKLVELPAMDAVTFFEKMAQRVRFDEPLPQDSSPLGGVVALLPRIGLVPGRPFNIKSLDVVTRAALEDAYEDGTALIFDASKKIAPTSTNWNMALDLGVYGRKYLQRASVARTALGANLYKDSVYAGAIQDVDGQPLTGAHRYVLSFDAAELPPVDPGAFWSVTLYNGGVGATENLFDNSIGRNALGIPAVQGHEVCLNPDRSLDLYIQADPPSDPNSIEYCNWLPAPAGGFILLLRMYSPGEKLFLPKAQNPWLPPAVQRLQ
jgi:hypothetical protein